MANSYETKRIQETDILSKPATPSGLEAIVPALTAPKIDVASLLDPKIDENLYRQPSRE